MPRTLHPSHVSLKGYRPDWSGPFGSAGSLRYCAARALWLALLAGGALLLRVAGFLL